jgi:hypothetical protein
LNASRVTKPLFTRTDAGIITGRVTDLQGQSFAGAQVQASTSRRTRGSTRQATPTVSIRDVQLEKGRRCEPSAKTRIDQSDLRESSGATDWSDAAAC